MRSRLAILAATIALVLMLTSLVPASRAHDSAGVHSSSNALLGGVNVLDVGPLPLHEADEAIAQAHELHASLVRTEVPWSVLEPDAPGQVSAASLAFMDRLVDQAGADGMRLIFEVSSSPCWASAAPPALLKACQPGQTTRANGWPPTNPQDYAAFVGYLAERYGNHLAAIEVWNEPDYITEQYFAGPHKASRYAALLRSAYPAIKRVDPRVTVLAGSLVGSNGRFLRALYAAGIKGHYDALAVHFYTLTLTSVRAIREVQLAHGDHKPLWLDEFGWSSCWPRYRIQEEQSCVTPGIQATNITNVFRELAQSPYVAAAVIYELQDTPEEDFGVLTVDGRHKPAFSALRAVLASPRGTPSAPTLTLRRHGSRLVASGSGPVGDYMDLEAFRANALRYRTSFILSRFNSYSITLPSRLGTSGATVRVFQYWEGPGLAAQLSG